MSAPPHEHLQIWLARDRYQQAAKQCTRGNSFIHGVHYEDSTSLLWRVVKILQQS
jgi:hypothetical protein